MDGTEQPAKNDRLRQKQRTRAALLFAALELAKAGTPPTVASAARHAKVSRATAYRYFPSPDLLMTEAALTAGSPMSVEDVFGDPHTASSSALERADAMVIAIHAAVCRDIIKVRLFMRTSLDRAVVGDSGRHMLRLELIDFALAPLSEQLAPQRISILRSAITVLVGLENMLTFVNMLRVDIDAALEVKRWAVRSLIQAALAERL